MALTPEGAALTTAHRLAQATISRRVTLRLLTVWPTLNPADLTGTMAQWLSAATSVIEAGHRESAALASAYYQAFRQAEIGEMLAAELLASPAFNAERSTAVLRARGPALLGPSPLPETITRAATQSASSGARVAMTGGRDTITATITADPRARGGRRIASAGCCAFCAMLTGRTYRSADTAAFQAHDHCKCQPEAVYGNPAAGATPQAAEFAAMYDEAKASAVGTGRTPIQELRRTLAERRAGD